MILECRGTEIFFVLGVFVDQTEDINDEVKTPQKEKPYVLL